MSDKLLPIDRVAELDNVGIYIIEDKKWDTIKFCLMELLSDSTYTYIKCLGMQTIMIERAADYELEEGADFAITMLYATPFDGGYGAAIHDFMLWYITRKYNRDIVSIADRGSVSDEAARVREIYANARNFSIDAFEIDNRDWQLTPQLDDDYKTHYRHGGFDVYPTYQGRRMANDPQAYKDWAIRLTDKGYREISPACEHLEKMGKKIRSYFPTVNDVTWSLMVDQISRETFRNVHGKLIRTSKELIYRYDNVNDFDKLSLPYQAPTLDKTKKTTQKLGSYTYNPRRRTRRIR